MSNDLFVLPSPDNSALVTVTYEQYVAEVQHTVSDHVNKQLEPLLANLPNLLDQATRAKCETRDHFARCSDLVKMIKTVCKNVDDMRKQYSGPFDKTFKAINKTCNAKVEPAETALAHLEPMMLTWAKAEEKRAKAEQERIRREEEDRALAAAEQLQQSAAALRKQEQETHVAGDVAGAQQIAERAAVIEQAVTTTIDAAASLPIGDTAVRRQRGAYGAVGGVRKTWVTKVVDITLLPKEFIAAINADEKAMERIRIAIQPLVNQRIQAAGEQAVNYGQVYIAGLTVTHESDLNVR